MPDHRDEPASPATPDEEAPRASDAFSRARGRLRGIALDMTPLRVSRDFRILWLGEVVSESGYQMTLVAVFVQVYALTNSPAAVGLVGLVQLFPLMLTSILGGPLVDRHDRRTLFLITQVGFAVTSTVLLGAALSGRPPLWLIYGTVGVRAGISGISGPARSAMIPRLVGTEHLPAALTLNQVMWNGSMIVGPALGGVIIARFGLQWAYAYDLATYSATLLAGMLMRPMPPTHSDGEAPQGFPAIAEGLRYLRGKRVLLSTFFVDLVAMIFGMPRALFPVIAAEQFHQGAVVVGGLFTAIAVGAVIGALTAGWVGRVKRQGLAVLVAVAIWGAGITGFGLVGDRLWPAFALLAVAGAADVISAVFRGTILQTTVPDHLRGRLSGIHILVVTGGPRIGDLEAGVVAQAFTPRISVVSGGLACIAGVLVLAAAVPEFVRYRASGSRYGEGDGAH